MQLDPRLPHTAKEGAIYGGIICLLTSCFMTVLNVYLAIGSFNSQTWLAIAKYWPLMFVIAMIVEPMIVGRLAEKAMLRLSPPTDSGNAKILFRMVFTVFGMSLLMTTIANAIVFGVNAELFDLVRSQWPRNFLIVLIAEALVIQPIARLAMVKLHQQTQIAA